MSIILSIMGNFLSTVQKHNRQNFEHNRPGPTLHKIYTSISGRTKEANFRIEICVLTFNLSFLYSVYVRISRLSQNHASL